MGEETKQEQARPEETKPDEKPEEPKPLSPFILYVDLHCVGCAKKIENSIMKIRGVEGVEMDMAKNQVTIKGIVEPQAVCNKIMKKTKRRAKVLSPLPATDGEPMPQIVTSQVSGSTTVELNVNMHCEACALQLQKKILKMRGVQTAETELSTGKVTVTGTMDGNMLVDYVYRRMRKQARIIPQPEPEPEKIKEAENPAEEAKPEEKKEEKPPEKGNDSGEKEGDGSEKEKGGENKSNEEELMKRMMHYYQSLHAIERIPPPQLFSDENPNACCIS